MKAKIFPVLAVVMSVGVSVAAMRPAGTPVMDGPVSGDYLEARTCSVFAGACHYNGELVTTGKDAVMAWSFSSGSYHGVALKGVRAMAAVTSEANLGDASAERRSALVVDTTATPQQVAAVADLLRARGQLGNVVTIRQTPVTFIHGDQGYVVKAPGFGAMDVMYRADNSCCIQPHMVWYEPFTTLEHRKVGYTQEASFEGKGWDPWVRSGEDSAFYGKFTF